MQKRNVALFSRLGMGTSTSILAGQIFDYVSESRAVRLDPLGACFDF